MLADAGIASRVISLELTVKTPMTQTDMVLYEDIDMCVTKYMLRAEKNVESYTWVEFHSLLNWCTILTTSTFGEQ